MKPSSASQFEANLDEKVPAVEAVREGIWAIGLAMPSPFIRHSFSYAIADEHDRIHLIDSSWESDDNWELLNESLRGIGHSIDSLASVTMTHLHRDHLGMAERIRAASGSSIGMHEGEVEALSGSLRGITVTHEVAGRLDLWGVPDSRRPELEAIQGTADSATALDVDVLLTDGDRLDIPGRDIRVIHTPGHTIGHACYSDTENGLLFSGDHVLPTMYSGLGLGGVSASNPLADYLASLDRVAALGDVEVLPGHGYRFTGLDDRCTEIAEHHLRRSREVESALSSGASGVWDIAAQLSWTAGWDQLKGFYLLSALSQTSMHIDYLAERAHA